MNHNQLEIERKFLVLNNTWKAGVTQALDIRQAYLDGGKRIRIVNEKTAIITEKTDIDGHEIFLKHITPYLQIKGVKDFVTNWALYTPQFISAPWGLNIDNENLVLKWKTLSLEAVLTINLSNLKAVFEVPVEAVNQTYDLNNSKVWKTLSKDLKTCIPKPLGKKEIEGEINLSEGLRLIDKAQVVLHKTRHIVPYEGQNFEVDVFNNLTFELVMAEIELTSETQEVNLPAWAGLEVSFDKNYKNFELIKNVKIENKVKTKKIN